MMSLDNSPSASWRGLLETDIQQDKEGIAREVQMIFCFDEQLNEWLSW